MPIFRMIRIVPIRPITVVVARLANAPENTGVWKCSEVVLGIGSSWSNTPYQFTSDQIITQLNTHEHNICPTTYCIEKLGQGSGILSSHLLPCAG